MAKDKNQGFEEWPFVSDWCGREVTRKSSKLGYHVVYHWEHQSNFGNHSYVFTNV